MTDVLLSPSNFWFSIALIAVFFVFILELVSTIFGASLLGLGDDFAELDGEGFLSTSVANWLNINKVPFLIYLVVLLTLFGLIGLILNGITASVLSFTLPALMSVPLAFLIGLLITAKTVKIFASVLPSVESSAVNSEDFIGSVAEITIGKASRGNPAEAKFTDHYSQPHFVLVEPFEDEELFAQGERVILVQKNQHSWLATRYL
ncbi:YqiJ family protein [Alteromonas sp. ALT199]|uniref:OB-fold-containig protein n=1 Tax=unclassified Alteromonas TaxID=2614992 RepID=UPI000450F059|nr:OB-fold-containig protein [Alteromonas sp. ALT199]MBT3136657.1 YqiJ family protein [Alteromonas sp. ALT199]